MDQKQYEAEVKDLEVKLDRLRSLYDQYFRGLEKLPPTILKKEVEGKLRELVKHRMKNTALRFRLQVQIQRFTTFLAYWQRMQREQEEGKLTKIALEEGEGTRGRGYAGAKRPRKRTDELLLDIDVDLDLDGGDS
jgi:hypothetical protein